MAAAWRLRWWRDRRPGHPAERALRQREAQERMRDVVRARRDQQSWSGGIGY